MDATVIRMSRVMPLAVGLLGLLVVGLCVPLLVVAADRFLVLAVVLGVVLAAVTYVCVRLLLTRSELRVGGHGVEVRGRRRRVVWTWEEVAAVGFLRFRGNEFLALRPAGAVKPRLRFFLYPTWSDQVNAVVLGRLDYLRLPRAEIQQAFGPYAGDRWTSDLPAA
ncbi:hypothetical protein SAMN05421678_101415 [Actinopolymorpha cephalotaxi]|uniref:PH domain-containing protein n=1 Tax=Actinopolymorpha cephalotaxi TaxID=504797 RepID=A0A1I2KTC5_9ACTN|nr:hypothetical protein [Actinopolymorpha cephalotaxi]NYH84558.1 hypothetical protein [Actinopolymorpha cephalotaxi]SFF68437.1 hypothetical protein SAMN05421678_101415 [Actinopolymorpha cephalotaxi]